MKNTEKQKIDKQIISDYMRELGKKGGSKNKEKGREYFVELAKRSHIKRRETKEANQ